MIMHQILAGMRDRQLSEKLQMEAKLDLKTCIDRCRQKEFISRQQGLFRTQSEAAAAEPPAVGAVQKSTDQTKKRLKKQKAPPSGKPHGSVGAESSSRGPDSRSIQCGRCGYSPCHPRSKCPARAAKCNSCGKTGHFGSVCRSKRINEIDQSRTEDLFFGALTKEKGRSWMITVTLDENPIEFKIDSGADATVIPESVYRKHWKNPLNPTSQTLKTASGSGFYVLGTFEAKFAIGGKTSTQTVYVIRNLRQALLGLPAIEDLRILSRVNAVTVADDGIISEYPSVFSGLGQFETEYRIELKENAKPWALPAPRRITIPLRSKVKDELDRMQSLGVISKVDQPTDWCAGMVVVVKPNKVRICVDLTKLNLSVKRERHILPAVEETLAQLKEAHVFSKLDANSGFWQIPLANESRLLTTFITPFGRYCFNRLPFGISSAPEHFQKRMQQILEGLEGVACMMDDILVFGRNKQEHDRRLHAVLQRLEEAKITLNREKCEFGCDSVKFLGQIVGKGGVHTDPEKVAAIQQMPAPTNVPELRRFLGLVNHQAKYLQNLAELTAPLRELLKKEIQWTWSTPQKAAFESIKRALTEAPVLAIYDVQKDTILTADASSYGLGAVLSQVQSDGTVKPVAYASRSLTPTQRRYAQIDKEALALVWGTERFHCFLAGKQFQMETDHKPLVSLLGSKPLEEVPLRVQRFRMRLMSYLYTISHVPGKPLYTADALSRNPVSTPQPVDTALEEEAEAYACAAIDSFPGTDSFLSTIREQQDVDAVCRVIKRYVMEGWPPKSRLQGEAKLFANVQAELSINDGLLLRGHRLVIPAAMRAGILDRLHDSHQGVTKSRALTRQYVWWPRLSTNR
jgi:hypothetical protein